MTQENSTLIIKDAETYFIVPISRPDFGSSGKTGSWRTERPVINEEKCTKCLYCWLYCPEDTILRREDDMVYVDYDYCKGCGICAAVCPVNAIEMVPEVKRGEN
ncbi:4Fe-4S binding protein [Caldisphaera sp.]|jgi:pyruvate ferredoxin oxidoreductase delta subunit|uniref:4Fe-4S binding protein n=1 Tax=Caldisphaera sp. TaxID=2060322 RepID=UPI000CC0424A|nr:MAG: ferredoxin [Caldisphaera sp.]